MFFKKKYYDTVSVIICFGFYKVLVDYKNVCYQNLLYHKPDVWMK